MSLKDITKSLLDSVKGYVAELELDHERMQWLDKNADSLDGIVVRVANGESVREAIDAERKTSTHDKFDHGAS